MSDEYYELYQQCKLERDQIKQQLEVENKNNYEISAEMEHLRNQLKEAVEVITEFNEYREATDRKETSKSNTKWHTYERILYDKAKRFIANYRGIGEKNTTNE